MRQIFFLLFILVFDSVAIDKDLLYRQLARHHHNIGYGEAKKYLFGKLFLQSIAGAYFVTDLYCGRRYGESAGVGPMLNAASTDLNCEHTWPKKDFNPHQSFKLQESDLHHLFPVDARVNSLRGNLPFAEVEAYDQLGEDCLGPQVGKPLSNPQGPLSFEPPDSHKGNVARALFYFSIRYRVAINSLEEAYLRQWHWQDPVDDWELWQNQQIEEIQGNRNPFVDDPSLVEDILDF